MSEAEILLSAEQQGAADPGAVQRTDPKSLLVTSAGILWQLVIPIGFAMFTIFRDEPLSRLFLVVPPIMLVVLGLGVLIAYLPWRRFTYTIGATDIRVESGVLSRSARSVPYERIQDVSLEQKLLPRLLGLVSVKFETGAGGGDDLALTYLTEHQGEQLRDLVRVRRDEAEAPDEAPDEAPGSGTASPTAKAMRADTGRESPQTRLPGREADAKPLFTMGPKRLLTFGLFEFSLAVFAVLAGVLQYLDTLFKIEIWDVDFWRELAQEQGGWLLELGAYAQALSVVLGLVLVFFVGSATGLVRTFNREWGFLLERTARGFRRRRGALTLTDVVMPVHRVQGVTIGTGFIRYRFGWHSLKFVSLAQDAGSSNHVVAPFAQLDELDPIVEAAGFHRPSQSAQWHRASEAYRNVSFAIDAAIFAIGAVIAAVATTIFAPDWTLLALGIVLALAVLNIPVVLMSWRFKKHALETNQIVSVSGYFAPTIKIAARVKLHSVEIAQGPFAKMFGYATLNLGMAGGEMEIEGLPLERARQVRVEVLETIAATDFSELESQHLSEAA